MKTWHTARTGSPLHSALKTPKGRASQGSSRAKGALAAVAAPPGSMSTFVPAVPRILCSVDPSKTAHFLKKREQNVMKIFAKRAKVPSLGSVPYTASIHRTLLKSLFLTSKLELFGSNAATVEILTDADMKACIISTDFGTDKTSRDTPFIESVLSGFAMPTKILNAEARVTTFCADFPERFEERWELSLR